MSEHTPRPWNIDDNPDSNYGCQIAANTKIKAKRVVCRLGGPDREANAAFIVKAVNNLDALVQALALQEVAENAHMNCDECDPEDAPETCGKCFPLYDDARIARRTVLALVAGPKAGKP